jgi:hypothetical protein
MLATAIHCIEIVTYQTLMVAGIHKFSANFGLALAASGRMAGFETSHEPA